MNDKTPTQIMTELKQQFPQLNFVAFLSPDLTKIHELVMCWHDSHKHKSQLIWTLKVSVEAVMAKAQSRNVGFVVIRVAHHILT